MNMLFFRLHHSLAAPVVLGLLLCGCSAPLTISHLNLTQSYAQADSSALAGDSLSNSTKITLRRYALLDEWRTSPPAAIAALHLRVAGQPSRWQDYFALAELSYLEGKTANSRQDFLAAALYAYAFLDPGATADVPTPYDGRFSQAVNIYNLSLLAAFPQNQDELIQFSSGSQAVPFGAIDLAMDENQLDWHGYRMAGFVPTSNLAVTGLQNIYRNPGIGEPLAAKLNVPEDPNASLVVSPDSWVPANLLLTFDHPRQQLAQSQLHGKLEIHTFDVQQNAQIGQQSVPLEYDQTTAQALALKARAPWSSEISGFLNAATSDNTKPHLIVLEPHQYGHMPIIFVHGTASSPFRWADMVNDLTQDPQIRDHFEFWFFSYASGNPIPYSALQLRKAINGAVAQLGGTQADPALGKITLIGHSQGGLLVKMMVIDPGDKIWNGLFTKPISQLNLTPKSRALFAAGLMPKPLPEVQRVIFIATPHRGSYLAAFSLSQLIGRLVKLPATILDATFEVMNINAKDTVLGKNKLRVVSINGMSPNSPFIKILATIPIVPCVHAHSIIPVQNMRQIASGNDGVVQYSSAHIAGVDSELIVHSGHSTQSNPETIAEVHRILLLQLAQADTPPLCGP